MRYRTAMFFAGLLTSLLAPAAALAAFPAPVSYQGRLENNGVPANGSFDIQFSLYDDLLPGAPDNLIETQTLLNVPVTAGLFTVEIPFGTGSFDGSWRYLQIAVRPAGGGGYTTLTPRERITDSPESRHAAVASKLSLPFAQSGPPASEFGSVFSIENSSDNGYAIYGHGPTWGVVGTAGEYLPYPPIATPAGLFGIGEALGAGGFSSAGTGILGITSTGVAGEFQILGTNIGTALWAHTDGTGLAGLVEIDSASNGNPALIARTASTISNAYAVHAIIESTSPGGFSSAIRAENRSTTGNGIGVYATQNGAGWGVLGQATTGIGIYGSTTSGYAGYFSGPVHISGTLSKSAGSFKIDHPLDPANKYLSHSFVESPDMKNIYDGVVTLNADGRAEVQLPDYFEALNADFRYQLTCLGGFANVYIAREISANSFAIAGGTPGLRVSWQVTGSRIDAYARDHRIEVETDKPDDERGRYLYPEGQGQPHELGLHAFDPKAN